MQMKIFHVWIILNDLEWYQTFFSSLKINEWYTKFPNTVTTTLPENVFWSYVLSLCRSSRANPFIAMGFYFGWLLVLNHRCICSTWAWERFRRLSELCNHFNQGWDPWETPIHNTPSLPPDMYNPLFFLTLSKLIIYIWTTVISDIDQAEKILQISVYPRVAYQRFLNGCLIVSLSRLSLYRGAMCQFPLWSNRGRSLVSKKLRIINCNKNNRNTYTNTYTRKHIYSMCFETNVWYQWY